MILCIRMHIGRLDIGLDEARAKGWTVVNMQRNRKIVHPPEGV